MSVEWCVVLALAAAPSLEFAPRAERAGSSVLVATYRDPTGEHRLTFTEHPITKTKAGLGQKLTALHERRSTPQSPWAKVWEAKDFVEGCEFDLSLQLIDASVALSDANDDGRPEVSFMYRLGCRSDVSPLTAKLLLYDGATKYAVRGRTRVVVGQTDDGTPQTEGGDSVSDQSFKNAPTGFVAFAQKQWARFIDEQLGQ